MTDEHRETMKEIRKLQDHIEDLRDEVRKMHRTAEAMQDDMRKARLILEDLKKRWEDTTNDEP